MEKKSFICISFTLFLCFLCSNAVHSAVTLDQEDENKSKEIKADESEQDYAVRNLGGMPKEIEVNSVNFIKLKSKPNEIFIPNPDIADVDMLNDSSLYLIGLAPGVTSLVVHDKSGDIIANYQVKVTYPLRSIKEAISEMHPDANVDIISVDSSIILKGNVPSPEVASDVQDIVGRFVDSSKIVNKLSIKTATQVMLKVKIAEVSRSLTKSLRINWRAISNSKDVTGMSYGFVTGSAAGSFPEASANADIVTRESDFLKQGGLLGRV